MSLITGENVKKYFEEHPEAVEAIQNIEVQTKLDPHLTKEELYRPLRIEDISLISFEGWEGQKGVFAWYYPLGVPHYTRIGE